MNSTYDTLQQIKRTKSELIVNIRAPRFKAKAKFEEDFNFDDEQIELISNVQTSATKDILFSKAKECPWPTKPHNISQKIRRLQHEEHYGITKLKMGERRYIFVVSRENIFRTIIIGKKEYPGLYDVLTSTKQEFWNAVRELIENYDKVKQLTVLYHLAKHYNLHNNKTKEEAIALATTKAFYFLNGKIPPKGFELSENEKTFIQNIISRMPPLKHIKWDYMCAKSEDRYNQLLFELTMIDEKDEKRQWLLEQIQTRINDEEIQKYKKTGFEKYLFDYQFRFNEIELPDINKSDETLQLRKLELENKLKEKKIDEERIKREMLIEFDARIKATEEMKKIILNSYEQPIHNFTTIIKSQLSDLMNKLTKPNEKQTRKATITKKTMNLIKNFCNDIKRINTEFQLESIDKFADLLIDQSYACVSDKENFEQEEEKLKEFIQNTMNAIEIDNSRLSKTDRISLAETEYEEIFHSFDTLFTDESSTKRSLR